VNRVPERGPSPVAEWARERDVEAARAELWLARVAVPCALVLASILAHTGPGRFFMRTFAGMWLHELGHAVIAWLCGFPAFPGPWITGIAESRSVPFALLITAGLGCIAWRGWTEERRVLIALAASGFVLQLFGTLALSPDRAQLLITFGGDGGALVFGAALMATFFTPPGHPLHRDWLRWGFLVIGAAAFADTFSTWWTARHDYTAIPFGEIEGVGDSDPSKLNTAGWTVPVIVSRYVALGVVSLVVLFVLQFLHARRTRQALENLERSRSRVLPARS